MTETRNLQFASIKAGISKGAIEDGNKMDGWQRFAVKLEMTTSVSTGSQLITANWCLEFMEKVIWTSEQHKCQQEPWLFFYLCFYNISSTDEMDFEANTDSIGTCTDMKKTITSQWTDGGVGRKVIRDKWHRDGGSYLKAHLGENRNFEQSELKGGSSSKAGHQRTGRYGGRKWLSGGEGGKKIRPPIISLLAMLVLLI